MGLEPTTSGLEVQCAIQLRHASNYCISSPLLYHNLAFLARFSTATGKRYNNLSKSVYRVFENTSLGCNTISEFD